MSLKLQNNNLLLEVLSYFLSGFTGILGFINLITLRRLILIILPLSSIDKWSWRAIDVFSLLILIVIWLVLVMYYYYHYEKCIANKTIWAEISVITGIQLLILFVCQVIPILLGVTAMQLLDGFIIAAEAIVGTGLIALSKYIKHTKNDCN